MERVPERKDMDKCLKRLKQELVSVHIFIYLFIFSFIKSLPMIDYWDF